MKKVTVLLSIVLVVAVGLTLVGTGLATAQGVRCVGAGTIGDKTDPRATFSCILQSNVDAFPNVLQVNWGGNRFGLDMLTRVVFMDDPDIDPHPPRAGADTVEAWGVGSYNGAEGYHVHCRFTDAGEPGKVDWAWVQITESNGDAVMEYSGYLRFGNINMLNV